MPPPSEGREYNPLDYENLARNCVEELMRRGPWALDEVVARAFEGAGVYALFYAGDFPAYWGERPPEGARPIYVGKAVPSGARKGQASDPGSPLWGRLREHHGSIAAAHSTLRTADFLCRYLAVTPIWITMAERLLIESFQPVWNVCIEGFGNHDPGSGRHRGEVPWWDALHPGRPWAARLRQTRSAADALTRLDQERGRR